MEKIIITANEANQRLDRFLRKYLKNVPLSGIYEIIRKKRVKVNGKGKPSNYRLNEGDMVELFFEGKMDASDGIRKSGMDFTVLYEDGNIMAVDKPAGLITHPDKNHKDNTLTDQVLYYLYGKNEYSPENEITFRPAAVNRLDINTGGIVLFAKNYLSLQNLNMMIRERYINKYYLCIVKGILKGEQDIEAYLLKDEKSNMVDVSPKKEKGGKYIHTYIKTIKTGDKFTLAQIGLITGRSHQIRAQLKEIGHPIIGDIKYGDETSNDYFKKNYGLHSQFLYAYKIVIERGCGNLDYLSGKEIYSKLPPDLNKITMDLFHMEY